MPFSRQYASTARRRASLAGDSSRACSIACGSADVFREIVAHRHGGSGQGQQRDLAAGTSGPNPDPRQLRSVVFHVGQALPDPGGPGQIPPPGEMPVGFRGEEIRHPRQAAFLPEEHGDGNRDVRGKGNPALSREAADLRLFVGRRRFFPALKVPAPHEKRKGVRESAGQNRHGVADERAAWKRISEPFQP